MTRLLLDTHVLLWALLAPDRIPPVTLDAIRDPANELHVSAASAWEISTKHRLGKLGGAEAVVHGYRGHLRRLGGRELPITGEHALTAAGLRWEHRDPFDRMIAVQCMLDALVLVTADHVLGAFPGLRVVW